MNAEKEDFAVLLCGSIEGPFKCSVVVQGAVPGRCQQCNERVWTSPASLEHVTKEAELHGMSGVRILCMPCGVAYMKQDPETEIMPLSEGQKAELRGEGVAI